jgi:hypothetical protein
MDHSDHKRIKRIIHDFETQAGPLTEIEQKVVCDLYAFRHYKCAQCTGTDPVLFARIGAAEAFLVLRGLGWIAHEIQKQIEPRGHISFNPDDVGSMGAMYEAGL